jgi:tetratricopeptide (TPR) repeat protein
MSHQNLARVLAALGEEAEALEHYEAALRLHDSLAGRGVDSVKLRSDRLTLHSQVGDTHLTRGAPEKARPHYETAVALAEQLARGGETAQRSLVLSYACYRLATAAL